MKRSSEYDLDHLEREVQKTLQFLKPLPDIEPEPNFYGRLQTRLNRQNEARRKDWPEFFLQHLMRPAYLVIFILLNLVSTYWAVHNTTSSTQVNRLSYIKALAREYDLQNKTNDPLSYNLEER